MRREVLACCNVIASVIAPQLKIREAADGRQRHCFKDILKRIAVDIAWVLLHLKVDRAEFIETEYQTIEDRRADLVAHMWGDDGEFILHIEIQNDNRTAMPWRMLRYRAEIGQTNPALDIQQTLIYIGKAPLTMPTGIQQNGLDYRYNIIDMHLVDCQNLLTQDKPEALVLAILCDFKERPAREVIHFIIHRWSRTACCMHCRCLLKTPSAKPSNYSNPEAKRYPYLLTMPSQPWRDRAMSNKSNLSHGTP